MRWYVVSLVTAAVLTGCADDTGAPGPGDGGSPGRPPAAGSETTTAPADPGRPRIVATAARGLTSPWGLDFLPDGRAIVTERDTARVLLIEPPAAGEPAPVTEAGTVPDVVPEGEAGLLGVAVSPDFDEDRTVFFYVCIGDQNQVVSATLEDDRLGEVSPILTGIPNGTIHDGGALRFGPDGYLYVTTGETGERGLARDRSSYAGKILRITPEGDPAPGNPFGDEIWSWGHRNIEGLAWDDHGRLWSTEFGQDSADELNLIEPGADYGWPLFEGTGGEGEGYVDPLVTWAPEEASPAALAFADDRLWMAALRGERLWSIPVRGDGVGEPTAYFTGELGRLRTVVVAPDGDLWLTTSNTDGRGFPADDDDRILVLRP